MTTLSNRQQIYIGLALAFLIATTRSHHFATLHHLPDASWAVFFLAGLYLRPTWVLAALLGEAALTDFIATTWGGVSDFCITAAYGMLLPAYGSLWLAGRWYAGHCRPVISTLVPLSIAIFLGTLACQTFSSGGFYLFSGYFEPNIAEFGARFAKYYPSYLGSTLFYLGPVALLQLLITALHRHSADWQTKAR